MMSRRNASRFWITFPAKRGRCRSGGPGHGSLFLRTFNGHAEIHVGDAQRTSVSEDIPLLHISPFRPPTQATSTRRDRQVAEVGKATANSVGFDISSSLGSSDFPLYQSESIKDATATFSENGSSNPLSRELKSLEAELPRLKKRLQQAQKLELSQAETEHLPELTEAELVLFHQALDSWARGDTGLENEERKAIGGSGTVQEIGSTDSESLLWRATGNVMPLSQTHRKRTIDTMVERLSMIAQPMTDRERGDKHSKHVANSLQNSPFSYALDLLAALAPGLNLPNRYRDQNLASGLVRQVEWKALMDQSLASRNFAQAEEILKLMKVHGAAISEGVFQDVVQGYATAGEAIGLASFLRRFETESGSQTPSKFLEFLVEAHVVRGDKQAALNTLHHFEFKQQALPQRAYTRVISFLTESTKRPGTSIVPQQDKALAWDLFAHMRLAAHPVPTRDTYNAIIQSCADPADPQPERALDLLVEMEQENKIFPDGETFDAAILACSRVKKFYLQGFKLLRRMLDLHKARLSAGKFVRKDSDDGQDSADHVVTGYEPTLATFNALLEGCKRRGDLVRARWILAEVVRMVRAGAGRGVDEEMIVNVLQCYASFTPTIQRLAVPMKGIEPSITTNQERRQSAEEDDSTVPKADNEFDSKPEEKWNLLNIISPEFAPSGAPQTSSEALQEADRLFWTVLNRQSDPLSPFGTVTMSARLVNAYLSVHFAHDRLERSTTTWAQVWKIPILEDLKVRKNGWSYLSLMERAAHAKRGRERSTVQEMLPSIWSEYLGWSDSVETQLAKESDAKAWVSRQRLGLGPRQVEKTWVQSIRAHALIDRTEQALEILLAFCKRYPPSEILASVQPSPVIASSVRLSPAINMLEDHVPPHILFHDIDVLHHRLVRDRNLKGVGAVKWASTGYQRALESRRGKRIKEEKKVQIQVGLGVRSRPRNR